MNKAANKLHARIGIILIIISVYFLVESAIFFTNSNQAVGVVTDYKEGHGGGTRLSIVYYPIVTFKCCNHKLIEFVGKPGVDPPEYTIGENVDVLFDPSKPETAKIYSFSSILLLPFFGLCF